MGRLGLGAEANRLRPEDRAVHDWYRFVLSFPPHLVRSYLDEFNLPPGTAVLDPFCGTGTTVVECKKQGIASVGIEANPLAQLASRVKTRWDVDADRVRRSALRIAGAVRRELSAANVPDEPTDATGVGVADGLRGLDPEAAGLLLAGSICARPLHKALVLRDAIERSRDDGVRGLCLVALARVLVMAAGNLHFGPEVGVSAPKIDTAVVRPWLEVVRQMARDLESVAARQGICSRIVPGDARSAGELLEGQSIGGVITSPPYPNEKDYTRTTRLESVVLGLLRTKQELRGLKRGLMRSNTRGVYVGDADDGWVKGHRRIEQLAEEIERRRIEMGKTSGFERLYARVTKLYFGGMARHLAGLRRVLVPGAKLAYVVGDQGSYLQVLIRTGELLAELAEELGYRVVRIDLFRTRAATATRQQLREEVVVLEWTGKMRGSGEPNGGW